MKKVVMFGVAAVMAVSFSIAAFASGKAEKQSQKNEVSTEISMHGNGPCTYGTCKCKRFVQRPGYNQCYCGHQRFSHK